jgi:hypothetical protein
MYNVSNSMANKRKINIIQHPLKRLSKLYLRTDQKDISELNNCSSGQPNLSEMYLIKNSTVA